MTVADALQRQAADPTASVWVAASAGTGKTKVLTDRVLTLLLAGSAPTRILCLTFTRAAAAEMANRLQARLSLWAVLEEGTLWNELRRLLDRAPSAAEVAEARRLFAKVLDAPGGLGIETIHGFCQSLLRRFPVEAGVAPHFELMDERDAAELLFTVREEVLAAARAGGDARLAGAVTALARGLGEQRFSELLDGVAASRSRFQALLERPGGIEGAVTELARRLDLPADATETRIIEAACAEGAFDAGALRGAAAAMQASKAKTDQARGLQLADWLADTAGRAERFDAHLDIFFTREGAPRTNLLTKNLAATQPAALAAMQVEARRLEAVRSRCAAAALLEASAAAMRLAAAILEAYRRHKESRAVLDYEDLVAGSIELLERPGVAPWVLFKLDGGLDHLLIDEAQDTNPDQWRVVQALTAEFYAGSGARDRSRTVFAVGDAKQSIFSFQGADPRKFLAMRDHFAARAQEAEAGWRTVALETSFRSTDAVLQAVDAVFARAEAVEGVALDGAPIRHLPHRAGHAGRVEIWPLIEPPAEEKPMGWRLPIEPQSAADPQQRLAAAIADRIRAWLDSGERLPSRDRRITAGDVMVLVRKRTAFVPALVRALKDREVPVAGADRMRLTEQLAVEDMIALGGFLLLPEDDLTLATVLKGPLFAFSEEQLFALAHGRGETSLWRTLYRRADEHKLFRHAVDTLTRLLGRADFAPPYELFAEVLGPLGGRRKLLARLGPEASDPLDEFLAAALAYEADHPPSLQGFLHWLVAGEAEVKRDLDRGVQDEVRILTVHGAKGLEAPIVFLPDTASLPDRVPPLQWRDDGLPLYLVPRGRSAALAVAAENAAQRRQRQEYRRLLYVAMTRAADRLYVCGWKPGRGYAGDCWYELMSGGLLGAQGVERVAMDFGAGWAGEGLVLATAQRVPGADDGAAIARAELPETLPVWAQVAPPPEPSPPKPLAPSRPSASEPAVRSPLGADQGVLFQRGLLVHRLLQSLPEVAPERRRSAAERFLALPVHELDAEMQASILAETLAVLETPEFAALFARGSRAEVPVVGLLGGRALAGQIDRLLVTPAAVLIVDYKTLRPAPASEREVPAIYLEQLAAYRAAVAAIYPGREVRAALLWTDGPRLMPISPALLAERSP
ncbi:MAG TPA: double-strand break repair helicase AddA [Stellaceae bacterium]|nr:double-strand break repair helicase AddA [Stellaceae bacterium]